MPITDGPAVKFVKEQVRPVCERLRALMAEIDSMRTDYAVVSANYGGGAQGETVVEGESDGRTPLTGQDVLNVMAVMDGLAAQYTAQVKTRIGKPCVRPLDAS